MSLDQPIQPASNVDFSSHTMSPQPLPASQPAETTYATAPNSPTGSNSMSATVSAPEIGDSRLPIASFIGHSPSFEVTLLQSNASTDVSLAGIASVPESSSGTTSPTETDPQILEALRSKDRLWVLKLGEMMEGLITERKQPRIDLTPATSYQRMLVHRCSAYYKLVPEADPVSKIITVYYRAESRIPARRICELVPVEESAQPAFKIMRRAVPDRRNRSQPEFVTGDDGDVSDVEVSEAGSVGGRSNVTGTGKRHLTIEEREAAYNEARSRIFMGFDDKEKEKDVEKGSSANSSSISLVSGSGSTSAGHSSAGDADESVSSAATESEWSGPAARDRRDKRRMGSGGSVARSLRSGNSYNPPSGSSSSRHSRAASPSFTYPSLYDPSAGSYDPNFGPQGPPHGYIQYYYPSYPSQAPTGPPMVPNYPYPYATYGYPPPHPQQHSDPTSPSEHPYPSSQPAQPVAYGQPPYGWAPAQAQASQNNPPAVSPSAINPNLSGAPHTHPSTPQGPMPYPSYFPPPYPPYPMSGFYGAPQYGPPPAPPLQQPSAHVPAFYADVSHDNRMNGSGPDSADHSRAASRNSNGHGPTNGNGRKQAARRSAWSYGPGVGNAAQQFTSITNEIVGPRMSNRRTSSGSQTGNRTPGDETSSVASSSTTSSTSQRTFTSNSSKHPLPARPDWAVGLKAQPTLSSGRHHDHSNPTSRTMSPARFGGNLPLTNQRNAQHLPSQQPPQPTDFPPLSSAPEKKTPVIGGAWTNSSNIRSVLRAGPPDSTNGPSNNIIVHYPNSSPNPSDQERGFERPPPKSNAELFNPKASRRQPANGSNGSGPSPDKSGGRSPAEMDALIERVGNVRLGSGDAAEPIVAAAPPLIVSTGES